MAATKTRTGLGLDWRWTGAFLILNASEQLFLISDITIIGAPLCSLVRRVNACTIELAVNREP